MITYFSRRAASTAELVSTHRYPVARLLTQNDLNKLSGIMATRSDVTLRTLVQAMELNLGVLREVSTQTREENARIRDMATRGQRDSKILKTIAQMTALYLPATLIAVGIQ